MHEVWIDDTLLTFDGTVVELFGFPGNASLRFHVKNLGVEVGEPNRKGVRALQFDPATKYSGGARMDIPAEDWPNVEPVLHEILSAMPE